MRYRWDKKYLYWGITAFIVIVVSILFFKLLDRWSTVTAVASFVFGLLKPIVYGFVIAYLLCPVMRFCEKYFMTRLANKLFAKNEKRAWGFARGVSIVLALLFALAIVAILLLLVLPQLIDSVRGIVTGMPEYIRNVQAWIYSVLEGHAELEATLTGWMNNLGQTITDWATNTLLPQADKILTSIFGGAYNVVREVLNWLIGIIVSIYVLYGKEQFAAQSKKVLYSLFKPRHVNAIVRGVSYTHKKFGSYIGGQLLDALIVGVVSCIGLLLLRMPYAALIAAVMGMTNVIPFFGPFIGAIPSALLIFLVDPMKCLIYIIFVIVLQQVDGNIICPKILGKSTGMKGFWVMFAILLGGGLFGFVGMVCSVPIFAVLYTGVKMGCAHLLRKKNLPIATAEYRNIDSIDPDSGRPVYKQPPAPPEKPGKPRGEDEGR